MKCRKCGNKIFEQDKFCGVCGTPIEIKKEQEPSTNTVEKNNSISEEVVEKQVDETIKETTDEVELVEKDSNEEITHDLGLDDLRENKEEVEQHFSNENSQTVEKSKEWYYAIKEESIGPVSEKEIIDHIIDGTLTNHSLLWTKGMANWIEVKDSEFKNYIPQQKTSSVATVSDQENKKRNPLLKYLILTLFVIGAMGAGFYVYNHQQQIKHQEELARLEGENVKKAEEAKQAEEAAKKAEEEKKQVEEEAKEKEEEAKQAEESSSYVVYKNVLDYAVLNKRTAPQITPSTKVGEYKFGDLIKIVSVQRDGDYLWGKTSDGYYVCIEDEDEIFLKQVD